MSEKEPGPDQGAKQDESNDGDQPSVAGMAAKAAAAGAAVGAAAGAAKAMLSKDDDGETEQSQGQDEGQS